MICISKRKFKCSSEKQKKAIRISYAKKAERKNNLSKSDKNNFENKAVATVVKNVVKTSNEENDFPKDRFPQRYPFWARLKINKNRTTLVIDDEMVKDKKNRMVPGFVHREAIHDNKSNRDYEEIKPNPDTGDSRPMYLKRPSKLPQVLFKPHNKNLNMPQHLIDKYDKNNDKNKK